MQKVTCAYYKEFSYLWKKIKYETNTTHSGRLNINVIIQCFHAYRQKLSSYGVTVHL